MTKYITAVYAVENEAEFEEQCLTLMESFSRFNSNNPPSWGVSRLSLTDDVKRLKQIEQLIESDANPTDTVQGIMSILNNDAPQVETPNDNVFF